MKTFLLNLGLGYLSALLRQFGIPTHCELAIAMGRLFGPEGCKHFSELSALERAALLTEAPELATDHDDWVKPLRWIPRWFTVYAMPDFEPPQLIQGTAMNVDIPEPGTWGGTRGYIAFTSPTNFHLRFGFRHTKFRGVGPKGYLTFPSFTAKQL